MPGVVHGVYVSLIELVEVDIRQPLSGCEILTQQRVVGLP